MSENIKKFVPLYVALVGLFVPRLAFADPISSSSFSGVITAITAQLNVTTIAEVLTYAAGIAVAMWFFWWGVRKALRIIKPAFSGRGFRL